MEEIVFSSASTLLEDIISRKRSVVDVVAAFLTHIRKHNPAINAVCDLRAEDDILCEAREKDEALKFVETVG